MESLTQQDQALANPTPPAINPDKTGQPSTKAVCDVPTNDQIQGCPVLSRDNVAPVLYTAVGWVAGTYLGGKKKFELGTLVTQDGQTINAFLSWQARHQLKKLTRKFEEPPELSELVCRWKIYPRTGPLRFDLVEVKLLHSNNGEQSKNHQAAPLDRFRVVGEIKAIEEGKVIVCIRRNELLRERSPRFKRLILTLKGSLPEEAVGQIWELKVRRQANKLSIAKGKPYQASAEDLAWLQKAKQNHPGSNEIASTTHTTAESTVNAVGKESDGARSPSDATQLEASPSEVNQKAETTTATSEQSKISNRSPGALRKTTALPPLADESASKKQLQSQEKSPALEAKQKNQYLHQSEKNCSAASTTLMETQRQKPAFQVKVNDKIFSGYNSVTLNQRVVRIDGKPVAQAKMALVLGQSSSIHADGGITQGRNQTVLMGM